MVSLKTTTKNHASSFVSDKNNFFCDETSINERPRLLIFSANDDVSLKAYSKAIVKHLINLEVDIRLCDMAYTLSERRTHHFHRAYVVAQSTSLNELAFVHGKMSSAPPRVGFVFTGQGAQWSQMGKGLIEAFPSARRLLENLNGVLQRLSDPPRWSLIGTQD